MIGPKKKAAPPMKAISSTPPERAAPTTLGGDDLEVDRGQPAGDAGEEGRDHEHEKRTCCVL